MIPTHGLTHISLKVADLDRSLAFNSQVLGVVEYPFAYIADPYGYEIEIWHE